MAVERIDMSVIQKEHTRYSPVTTGQEVLLGCVTVSFTPFNMNVVSFNGPIVIDALNCCCLIDFSNNKRSCVANESVKAESCNSGDCDKLKHSNGFKKNTNTQSHATAWRVKRVQSSRIYSGKTE